MGFPLLVQKMKSPWSFLAAGFCLGVRWQGQGVTVRVAVPGAMLGQPWSFYRAGWGFSSTEFLGFADGLIESINCRLFILVRGEASCFSWSVWNNNSNNWSY